MLVPTERERLLKILDVCSRLTIGRTTLYELRTKGDFPEPIRLSPRRVGWRLADIEAWEAAR